MDAGKLEETVKVMWNAKPYVKKRMEALRSQGKWDKCSGAQTSIVELVTCRQKIEAYLGIKEKA